MIDYGLLRFIGRNHVVKVLSALSHGEQTRYTVLLTDVGIPQKMFCDILRHLVEYGLVKRKSQVFGERERVYYSITPSGNEALKLAHGIISIDMVRK